MLTTDVQNKHGVHAYECYSIHMAPRHLWLHINSQYCNRIIGFARLGPSDEDRRRADSRLQPGDALHQVTTVEEDAGEAWCAQLCRKDTLYVSSRSRGPEDLQIPPEHQRPATPSPNRPGLPLCC